MKVTKKGVLWLLAAGLVGLLLVQVIDHFAQQSQIETQLASAINGYNNVKQEEFRADLLEDLKRFQVEIEADGIQIVEDRVEDRVTVEVHYGATLTLLIFPIERELVATRSTGLLS